MSHHRWALAIVAVTLVLDLAAAIAYAHLAHIPVLPPARGPYDGLDWAAATMFTTGDSNGPPPVTRSQHWLWLGVHFSLIPLGGAALALFTSWLASLHVRSSEARIKAHVAEQAAPAAGHADALAKLRDDVAGLADAVRAAIQPRTEDTDDDTAGSAIS